MQEIKSTGLLDGKYYLFFLFHSLPKLLGEINKEKNSNALVSAYSNYLLQLQLN